MHLQRRRPGSAVGLALVGALLLPVAACSQPTTVDAALLGVCVSPTEQAGRGTVLDIEFRLDGDVVASGSVQAGSSFVAEVPLGEVEVYVDGEHHGAGASYTPSAADEDGHPTGGVYLGGEGCPGSPF